MAKVVLTLPATLILLLHMQPIGHMAQAVANASLASGAMGAMRIQLVANAAAATVVLIIATGLSIYEPRGRTPYGWRNYHATTA